MPAKKKTSTKSEATTTKKPAKAKAAKKKLSALDAAAQVLAEQGGSMTTGELIETMAAKKLWESPNGKTPAATLYAAILREINTKGKDSRFRKTEPGKFAATGVVGKADASSEKPAPAPKAAKPKAAKGSPKKAAKMATEPAAEAAPAPAEATPSPDAVPAA
jgi:hypothetical protein